MALQESEERFRKVFEEGPLGVGLLGLDGRIQHVNRRFCEMLGYSEEEIVALVRLASLTRRIGRRTVTWVHGLFVGRFPTTPSTSGMPAKAARYSGDK